MDLFDGLQIVRGACIGTLSPILLSLSIISYKRTGVKLI
jgi:hypothetical protein